MMSCQHKNLYQTGIVTLYSCNTYLLSPLSFFLCPYSSRQSVSLPPPNKASSSSFSGRSIPVRQTTRRAEQRLNGDDDGGLPPCPRVVIILCHYTTQLEMGRVRFLDKNHNTASYKVVESNPLNVLKIIITVFGESAHLYTQHYAVVRRCIAAQSGPA